MSLFGYAAMKSGEEHLVHALIKLVFDEFV